MYLLFCTIWCNRIQNEFATVEGGCNIATPNEMSKCDRNDTKSRDGSVKNEANHIEGKIHRNRHIKRETGEVSKRLFGLSLSLFFSLPLCLLLWIVDYFAEESKC